MRVIDVMVLGFLADGPLHGYELRRRMEGLYGHARPISDGTLYPAIKRLAEGGCIERESEPGQMAAPRQTLLITVLGRQRLLDALRNARGYDISDPIRYFVFLAFLHLVPDEPSRSAVLARRLEFLDQPSSFFYEDRRPLHASEIDDPYRRGMLLIARAGGQAEKSWLAEMLSTPSGESPPANQ